MSLLACLLLAAAGPQLPATGTVVPFRIAQNAIIVDAKVNGRDVSLMFDSGFGGTVLLNSGIEVGPRVGGMVLRDFVGELHVDTVKLNSLQIGAVTANPDEKLIVKQPTNFSAEYGSHVDGILGLSAVKNMVTEVNFQKNEFIFYPPSYDITKKASDGKQTFLVKMLPIGGNAIELPVTTASGQMMTMALDTGNAFYATTHRDVLERVSLWPDGKNPNYIRKSGIASGAVDSWSFKMPAINIFEVPVQPTVWDVIDLPASDAKGDGTVGYEFLSHFNITFDFARRRVWFENWKKPIENEEPGEIGISAGYDRSDKAVTIVLVAPGSPADEAGIKEGDQILSIGTTDLEHPTFDELRQQLSGPVGSTVDLAISRDGQLKRFKVTRKALYN
ncbi:MAG TPA: PDZ domain-containing protein [Fimbriimonas sp.]|nr:PDZ domain-containing protein [Fimbriimonas sp.]